MPTERFYNLPAGKKKLILDATVEEFTRVPYEKVSINKIIKNAGISRGSFYTYFADKDDVLGYLFEESFEKLQSGWVTCARKNGVDLWKTAEAVLSYSMANTKENVLKLIKNIFDNRGMQGDVLCFHKRRANDRNALEEIMYQSIDTSGFKDQSMETFEHLITMIFFEIAHCMGWYYHHKEDEEKIKKNFCQKLEILQYGIRKH